MNKPEKAFKRYTVTSALPYANGPLHLGHIAGAYLPADIYVRFLRSRGKEVLYICGTDEHGVAITIRAKQEGLTPKEVVDKYHVMMRDDFQALNINFDNFSRTSKAIHHETAQEFFLKFHKENKFVEQVTEQLYDPEAKMFLADRYVTGTCPKCGYEEAYGDQCENCGSSLSATDLINPKSKITGSEPVLKSTRHWFLPLDQYQERLEQYILEDHKYWKNNVYGQCKSWLQDGLAPRAITRDLEWGVAVPVPEGEGKVLYVWFDAPIGYISATREWAQQKGEDWEKWWKDPETALIHFIGKDNIVFHCIIFPAILMGEGSYILPENVPANEFLNLEGKKLSTSRNYAVWVHEFVKDFPEEVDAMRYVLTSTMPETKDNNFTWEDFQDRINNELNDTLGNFIHRVGVLSKKYYDSVVPEPNEQTEVERTLWDEIKESVGKVTLSLENYRFKEALNEAMSIARAGNTYLADTEPWKLYKAGEQERVKTIMHAATQIVALLGIVLEPFIPGKAAEIMNLLQIAPLKWSDIVTKELVPPGTKLGTSKPLFRKIEDSEIETQMKKLEEAQKVTEVKELDPQKEMITFEEFQAMDIRVGTILEAEKVKKSDALLKLKVDIGLETRTIVSGIAKHFSPEDLPGKQATVLINIKPRKIRGVESQGMLLFAEDLQGVLHLVNPEDNVEPGASIN